ncbi:MAG: nitroreductase family protein [Lachnospiraceae bacterium]|nr:nitroreductase family protein [Lachnospiraceae bacterium]
MDTIKGRKSVRSYDGTQISDEHRKDIEDYIGTVSNPFGIPVEFVLLDAKEHGLSSPVLTGEQLYVAGKVEKKPYADVAFGYSFEELVLHAWTLGIGTVWIGGTMKRELFEKAAGLKEGQMMPCVSPLGYPAAKRSLKEAMMRKGIGADSRMPGEKLFFDGTWGQPYSADAETAELLEMVRWAPSAVNKQPWRIIVRDGMFHFYEKKDRGYVNDATGDLQKIDVGIALCHFVMGANERGLSAEVSVSDPGIEIPEDAEYIASVKIA